MVVELLNIAVNTAVSLHSNQESLHFEEGSSTIGYLVCYQDKDTAQSLVLSPLRRKASDDFAEFAWVNWTVLTVFLLYFLSK